MKSECDKNKELKIRQITKHKIAKNNKTWWMRCWYEHEQKQNRKHEENLNIEERLFLLLPAKKMLILYYFHFGGVFISCNPYYIIILPTIFTAFSVRFSSLNWCL